MNHDIIHGDAFDELAALPAESVESVVTDPPYGLAFMGRDWDDFEPREYQQFCEDWADAVKRILKPGGHLLAFSGNRTHHRLFTGVEDAGFEIRDTITWHYGSGFPKASDVSKTIDKRSDKDRDTKKIAPSSGMMRHQAGEGSNNRPYQKEADEKGYHELPDDEPVTDEAKQWEGWKTGLKPATEYIVVARKPFDGATVDCVLEHGTGALNIGECHIGTEERKNPPAGTDGNVYAPKKGGDGTVEGRYPANVVFGERAAETLDNQISEASRYFYTSKASEAERTINGTIKNDHPTVKPVDLIEWLVTLVTPEEGTVLDPFLGSGTTCLAADDANVNSIGIEQNEEYVELAEKRLRYYDTGRTLPADEW